jgi:hypothetical protein
MNKLLTFVFILMTLLSFGQKFDESYNLVIDYNGKERLEKNHSGLWTVSDSTLFQLYGQDTLEYRISKIQGRNVYHINDFGETVKFLFNPNGDVVRTNMERPNQYLIYRKK